MFLKILSLRWPVMLRLRMAAKQTLNQGTATHGLEMKLRGQSCKTFVKTPERSRWHLTVLMLYKKSFKNNKDRSHRSSIKQQAL